MARPLSEEKREAILDAATEAVAAMGTSAPTSKIAKAAGVAEGTLFTYFATKDDLLNALYLSIKSDMRRAVADDALSFDDPHASFRRIWDGMIDWNVDHGAQSKAMRQLAVSDLITDESRQAGSAAFREIEALFAAVISKSALKEEGIAFVGSFLQTLAETTAQFITQQPERRDHYKHLGFTMFWNAINAP